MKTNLLACSGYSEEAGNDLLLVRVDETGKSSVVGGFRHGKNPSFCVKRGNELYLVSERVGEAEICACSIDGEKLSGPNRTLKVPGGELCHLFVGEKAIYGSSYGTGDFFAVDFALQEILWRRQPCRALEGRAVTPHAHWMTQWQGQLLLADLGCDRIWRYRLQDGLPGEELPPLELAQGAGPRQTLPTGKEDLLLSVQELGGTLCLWKKEGETVRCVQSVRTTAFAGENYPGTICMADEETVLVCNRGANTIAAFGICGEKLEWRGEWETGNWPRHLMRIPETSLFVNGCNKEGKLLVFAWLGNRLEKRDEIALPGASCAAVL